MNEQDKDRPNPDNQGPPPEPSAVEDGGNRPASDESRQDQTAPAKTPVEPSPEASTEPPAKTSAEPPAKTPAEPPAKTPAEPPAKTSAEPPPETSVEPPTQTSAEPPAKTSVEPPAKTSVEPPTQTSAEPPPETSVEPPTQTSAEPPPETSVEPAAKPAPPPPRAPSVPELPPMVNLVGVKFKRAGKTYTFNAVSLRFSIGEQVIVETDRGLGLARVVTPGAQVASKDLAGDIKRVIRKANWNDFERDRKNKEREKEAQHLCVERILQRGLNMKLVRVEYLHDASKAIFYFTAEQRVDFRDLVKDLARQLHTRIEMRQIGVRDEAKICGGIGPCGRVVCCMTFLTEFSPVSVRMAKDQNLAMNPAKVSGLCGRLMCCLAYEHKLYVENIKGMPKKGKQVSCKYGPCRVIDLNILCRQALCELESGKVIFIPADELLPAGQAPEGGFAPLEDEETGDINEEILNSDDPEALEKVMAAREKKSSSASRIRGPSPRPAEQARPSTGPGRKKGPGHKAPKDRAPKDRAPKDRAKEGRRGPWQKVVKPSGQAGPEGGAQKAPPGSRPYQGDGPRKEPPGSRPFRKDGKRPARPDGAARGKPDQPRPGQDEKAKPGDPAEGSQGKSRNRRRRKKKKRN